jgi:hypothetical protein
MKSFHLKSILIGIGMGAILTAIISMIYMAGPNPFNNKLTDKEIIDIAKKLGMIEANSVLIKSGQSDTKLKTDISDKTADANTKISESSQNPSSNTQIVPTAQPIQPEPEMMLNVVRGDTSKMVADKLIKVNLISNKKEFIDELTKLGLTVKVKTGQYKIKKGTAIKEIIRVLTSRR